MSDMCVFARVFAVAWATLPEQVMNQQIDEAGRILKVDCDKVHIPCVSIICT